MQYGSFSWFSEMIEGAFAFWSTAASTRRQKQQEVFEVGQVPHWVDFSGYFHPGIQLGDIAGVLLIFYSFPVVVRYPRSSCRK